MNLLSNEETRKAELALLRYCEFELTNEPDRIAFRKKIGCWEGEYQHLKQKYSRVLKMYKKTKGGLK